VRLIDVKVADLGVADIAADGHGHRRKRRTSGGIAGHMAPNRFLWESGPVTLKSICPNSQFALLAFLPDVRSQGYR